MKYFTTALFALASAAVAVAQECNGINCFNNPPGGYQTSAGSTVNITWNPSTSGTVSLLLRSGNAAYLSNGSYIAQGIPNNGQYTWQVPSDIVRGSSYAFEIVSDQDPTKVNYTPQFLIDSPVLTASTSAASTSASASASASSGSVASSASTTASSMSTRVTGSATTSAASTSASASAASVTSSRSTTSSGSASRATAVAGLLGAVAFGALAL